ncbi:MAG: proteinral secretion pathway protein D [Gallionellaceae bacterium]|nr:MAG: proteinral secretion pathway protein D [Gallionellaceae bacterium]
MGCGLQKLIWGALCCAALLLPAAATGAPDEKVSLNFVNADIEEVVKAVSQITGRNFLVDPRVKGTINIISSTPVSSTLAYDILLSALRLQGFASVESGGVTKVMPEADAKLHVGAAVGARGAGDRLVTRVYVLKYESAAQLVPILRPLIAPNNIVVAYPNSNTLVVTDYASNLKRIEQIVEAIDLPGAGATAVIPLKRASAVDVAQTINRLLQDAAAGGGGDASQRFVLAADARSNSLLLRTDNPARVARVRDLAEKLDTETGAPGNIRVVYLKNADATKVAQTLRAVMSGDVSTAAAATAPQGGGQHTAPSGGGMIQADTASNALIITAPEAIYNNLRAVVEKLDVRRAQVFVEALIVEVTADKAAEFGVQWQSLGGTSGTLAGGGAQFGGGTNFGGDGTNILNVAGSIAKGAPVIGTGLNIGLLRGQNLGLLVRALENDANANILSTPNLLTLDNEEAKIIIGQNVPFITGSYAQTGNAATATPFQTIERKDVGLTLRIKPQVSQGGTVKLQIYQEVSSVQDKTINNAAGVVTNKRSLESSVLADEGQIIVLGGLIQDSVSSGEDKVPLLGDIPVLGNLFRHETRRHTKTNLMVFIRPHVLRAAEDSQGLTQDRYEYLRGEQQNSGLPARALLPEMPAPELPELVLRQELALPNPSPAVPAGKTPESASPAVPGTP